MATLVAPLAAVFRRLKDAPQRMFASQFGRNKRIIKHGARIKLR